MKILVCGTNYGSSYLRAVASQPTDHAVELKLAGILSNGSKRSLDLAKQYNIPHYSCIDDIKAGSFDIACVALPSPAGQQAVLDLLAKGCHVLCEHPIDPSELGEALNMAKKHQRHLFVNAHFADLPAPQAFINAFKKTTEHGKCVHFDLGVNLRTVYSGLDLLGRCLGGLESLTVSRLAAQNPDNNDKPLFANLLVSGHGVNVSVVCQNFTSKVDDGSANLLNHRLNALFNFGSLNLSETNGPVNWLPTCTPSQQWQNVYPVEHSVINLQQYGAIRDQANLTLLNKLATTINTKNAPIEQQANYLTNLSSLWHQCITLLN